MKRRALTPGLWQALRKRYKAPEWALVREVPDGTGFSGHGYADAVALNLWPSRGLLLVGFELKVHRNDWLRELKNPAKAERFAKFCDEWWLITTDGVAEMDEIPPAWGWLRYPPNAKSMRTMKKAQRKDTQPELPRSFTAAIVRRAHESGQDAEELKAARKEAYALGRQEGRSHNESATEIAMLTQKVRAAERELENYQKAAKVAGMDFSSWDYPAIAQYVQLLKRVPPNNVVTAYVRARQTLEFMQKNLAEAISDMKQIAEDRSASKEGP